MPMFRGSERVSVTMKRIQMDGVANTEAIVATPCLHMAFLSDSKTQTTPFTWGFRPIVAMKCYQFSSGGFCSGFWLAVSIWALKRKSSGEYALSGV